MVNIENKTIEQKIDKNEDHITDYVEIKNFLLDDENQSENIKDLGNYLNDLPDREYNGIRQTIQYVMSDPEIVKIFNSIEGKIKNNENLNNDEISIIYLEAVLNKGIGNRNFDLKNPIEKNCGGELLCYIQKKYNNYNYNPNKEKNNSGPRTEIEKETGYKNPNIPSPFPEEVDGKEIIEANYEGLPEFREGINVHSFNKLLKRAEDNYGPEIIKIENNAKDKHSKHRYKEEQYISGYVKYEKIIFALNKYYEIICKKDEANIKEAGYKDKEEFEKELGKIKEFNEFLNTPYGKSYLEYIEKLTGIKNELFKNNEELEEAEKRYYEYNTKAGKIEKESGIDMTKIIGEDGEIKERNDLTEEDVLAIFNYSIKMD